MKNTTSPWRKPCGRYAPFIVTLCGVANFVIAQSVNSETSEEPIKLSPFTVSAADDDGYRATSSLAGSRLKTQLKDIASQIDVITMDFAEDIGATSIEDIYEYSSSMESAKDFTAGPNGGVSSANTSRVRGFDDATQSSDFFKTRFGSDLYNKERITIANGPNSILFGLGLPGGIVNTQTKVASFKNEGMVQFQVDNEGGTRAVLDVNRSLIADVLAVRFVALDRQSETFRPGEFDDQRRYYGALTFKPLNGTVLKLKYEDIDRSVARATNYIAQDFVSPWFEAGRPLFDNSNGNGSINNNNDPLFRRNNSGTYMLQYGAIDTISAMPWNGSAVTKGPHQVAGAIDNRNFSVTNFDILPAYVDPRVGGRRNEIDGNILRATWEQRISDNLHFELAYSAEERDELSGGMFELGNSLNVRGDPNMYLADRVTPNPNAGKLYIESDPRVTERYDELEELRLTVSYELDFEELIEQKWLGRHRFAGLLSRFDQYELSQNHRGMVSGGTGRPMNSFVGNRFYLDPDSGVFTADLLQDSAFGPWTVTNATTGEGFTVDTVNNPNGAWQAAGIIDTAVDSQMIAVQSFFLDDHVNVFYGLRNDAYTLRAADASTVARQSNGLFPSADVAAVDRDTKLLEGDDDTQTFGVVVAPLDWLSFHYNSADNFQVPNGALSPFGDPLPGVSSDGEDYGLRTDFVRGDNRFSMRLNFYNDSQLFLQSGLSQNLKNMAASLEQTLRAPANIANLPAGFTPPEGFIFLQDIGESPDLYAGYSRKEADGIDFIGTGSFGRNWNVRFAVGKQETLVFGRAAEFRDWVSQRLPVWQDAGGLGWDNIVVVDDGTRTIQEYYNEVITPQIEELEDVDGLPRFRQREWRVNIFTNYEFTEGALKGFSLGSGLRWRDRAMVGANALGDQRYEQRFAPDQWYIDLAIGYRRQLEFAGRTVNWRINLNIRDIGLHDDIYEIRAVRDLSAPLDFAYDVQPRFQLTNTFRF